MAPKKVTWTPKQLEAWDATRRDLASPTLLNPRTGRPIQRDGPTYQELEVAYEKYSAKREAARPDESKAAAPKPKMESVLAAVMDRTIQTGDRRTAAVLGMINKDLQAEYARKTATLPAPQKGIVLTREFVREMIAAAYKSFRSIYFREVRMLPISDDKVNQIILILKDTMQQVRDMTRAKSRSAFTRLSNLPTRAEQVSAVVKKFSQKYSRRVDPFFTFHEAIVQTAVLTAWQNYTGRPTDIQKKLIVVIERAYNIPKDVAEFYAVFLSVYAEKWFQKGILWALERADLPRTAEVAEVSIEDTILL